MGSHTVQAFQEYRIVLYSQYNQKKKKSLENKDQMYSLMRILKMSSKQINNHKRTKIKQNKVNLCFYINEMPMLENNVSAYTSS